MWDLLRFKLAFAMAGHAAGGRELLLGGKVVGL